MDRVQEDPLARGMFEEIMHDLTFGPGLSQAVLDRNGFLIGFDESSSGHKVVPIPDHLTRTLAAACVATVDESIIANNDAIARLVPCVGETVRDLVVGLVNGTVFAAGRRSVVSDFLDGVQDATLHRESFWRSALFEFNRKRNAHVDANIAASMRSVAHLPDLRERYAKLEELQPGASNLLLPVPATRPCPKSVTAILHQDFLLTEMLLRETARQALEARATVYDGDDQPPPPRPTLCYLSDDREQDFSAITLRWNLLCGGRHS